MRKKSLAVMTAMMMLAMSLAACGGSSSSTTAAPAETTAAPATTAAAADSSAAETTADAPKNLEFICCYGAGGGHDTMLRNLEKAWKNNNIYNGTITYNYQNGGAQAVGMTYTMAQKGRNDALMSTTAQLVKTPMITELGFDWHDLEPLIIFGNTSYFMVVRSGLGVDSLDDLMALNQPLTFADTGAGSAPQYITQRLQQEYPDADITSVTFDGDGEILSQLLGGHIDGTFTDLGSVREYIEQDGGTGELKILASCTENRSVYLPDIPSLRELGHDIYTIQIRGMVAPPEMDAEYQAIWTDLLLKATETPEWEQYMYDNTIEPLNITGQELDDYIESYAHRQKECYDMAGVEVLEQYKDY